MVTRAAPTAPAGGRCGERLRRGARTTTSPVDRAAPGYLLLLR